MNVPRFFRALPILTASVPLKDLLHLLFWIAVIGTFLLARDPLTLLLAGCGFGGAIVVHGCRTIWQAIGWRFASPFARKYWILCALWFLGVMFQLPDNPTLQTVGSYYRWALIPLSVGFFFKRITEEQRD